MAQNVPALRDVLQTVEQSHGGLPRFADCPDANASVVAGFLVVNPRSGDGDPAVARRLCDEAERRGVRTHVLAPGEDAASLARTVDADALGVAGGDGSLAPVAAVAIERRLPFVCVPFGTRNHFARDLGLDVGAPVASLAAFDGAERRVDVGRVNGRAFLNNVSLGLYAGLVHRRAHHRLRRESLATVRALSLRCASGTRCPSSIDGRPLVARVVLVANNDYELGLFSLGARPRLDEGRLHLYAAGRRPARAGGRSAKECDSSSTRRTGRSAPRSTASTPS